VEDGIDVGKTERRQKAGIEYQHPDNAVYTVDGDAVTDYISAELESTTLHSARRCGARRVGRNTLLDALELGDEDVPAVHAVTSDVSRDVLELASALARVLGRV